MREMSNHEITFDTNLAQTVRTRADFTHKITPTVISITDTGLGSLPVTEDIEAVLRKIEHWHQGSISSFKIMCRDGKGFGTKFSGTAKPCPFLLWRKPTSEKPARDCMVSVEIAALESYEAVPIGCLIK
jgi:hypothetical protein